MASRTLYLIVAAAGIAAASGVAWWLQRSASAPPAQEAAAGNGNGRVVAVEVARVRQMPLTDAAETVGSLRSRQSVVVRPEISGRITQLNFRDGERVRRGQLLVQLDDQLPRAQVQQGQAELSIAQANHKRNGELAAQGFISQRSVDESAAALQVARAKLALADATAARLRILAPFDGITGIRVANVGDYVKDGADIVNVEDLDAVYVDFRLPERLQAKVRRGQTAQVSFDALPGVRYAATVQAINPRIDAEGRSVAVRACIDNRRLQLRPGMFARVTAVFGERPDARVVPEEAIAPQGQDAYVVRIVPGGEPGTHVARRVLVKLGMRTPGFAEVLEGLEPGDVVATAGQQRVQGDGAAVRVVQLGQAAVEEGASAPDAAASAPPPAAAAPALAVPLPGANPCLAAVPAAAGAGAPRAPA